jgi:hypothetical protein
MVKKRAKMVFFACDYAKTPQKTKGKFTLFANYRKICYQFV